MQTGSSTKSQPFGASTNLRGGSSAGLLRSDDDHAPVIFGKEARSPSKSRETIPLSKDVELAQLTLAPGSAGTGFPPTQKPSGRAEFPIARTGVDFNVPVGKVAWRDRKNVSGGGLAAKITV